jgi:hypothetical protein
MQGSLGEIAHPVNIGEASVIKEAGHGQDISHLMVVGVKIQKARVNRAGGGLGKKIKMRLTINHRSLTKGKEHAPTFSESDSQ